MIERKQAVIYARVSSKEQEKEGVMLPIYQAARNGGLGLASWSRSNCLGVL